MNQIPAVVSLLLLQLGCEAAVLPSDKLTIQLDKLRDISDKRSQLAQLAQSTNMAPSVEIEPSAYMRVVPGKKLEIRCSATSVPPATIQWFHNGKPYTPYTSKDSLESMVNDERPTYGLQITASKLQFECADRTLAGEFTCVAKNGYGVGSANITIAMPDDVAGEACAETKHLTPEILGKQHESLNVEPAKIYMWTDVRFEHEGASVQLFCRALGNPKPKIEWYHFESDGSTDEAAQNLQYIDDTDSRFEKLANGDLLVKHLQHFATDFSFVCKADNGFGSDKESPFVIPGKD